MLTTQVESFREGLEELKPLLPHHWEELALNKDKVPLDPVYEDYFAREDRGGLLYMTVRDAGKLVGYYIGMIAPGLHYRTCLTLTMDIFYIWPESRGSGAGWQLFKAVEKEAKRRGVQRMFAGTKLHKDISFLFEKLGYTEVERTFSVWLGDQ